MNPRYVSEKMIYIYCFSEYFDELVTKSKITALKKKKKTKHLQSTERYETVQLFLYPMIQVKLCTSNFQLIKTVFIRCHVQCSLRVFFFVCIIN